MLKSTIMSNGMLDRILKSSSIVLKSTSIIYDKATLNEGHIVLVECVWVRTEWLLQQEVSLVTSARTFMQRSSEGQNPC